jgi:hypothetical protein
MREYSQRAVKKMYFCERLKSVAVPGIRKCYM